jgi:hypothetical protein
MRGFSLAPGLDLRTTRHDHMFHVKRPASLKGRPVLGSYAAPFRGRVWFHVKQAGHASPKSPRWSALPHPY